MDGIKLHIKDALRGRASSAVVPHLTIRLPNHVPTLQIASIFTLPQGEIISAREVN